MDASGKVFAWNDTDDIAAVLMERFPDIPPVIYKNEELYNKILEAGIDLPKLSDDIYLTAVQHKMIKMWHGVDRIHYEYPGDPDRYFDLLDEHTYEDDSQI